MSDRFSRRDRSHKGFRDDDRDFGHYAPPPDRASFAERSDFGARRPSRNDGGPGTETDVTVKWFNPTKGFGFVELSDGSGDAFIGIRVVEAAGQDSLNPGAKLKAIIQPGQRGQQVGSIVEILDLGAAERPRRSPDARGDFQPKGPSRSLEGTVKWFNHDKGFGFVAVQGERDVFLHASALRRSGLSDVADGSPVSIEVVQGNKGDEVQRISLR